MVSEYLKEIINENIKEGAAIIFVKYIDSDYFIDIKADSFIGIQFDCLIYLSKGKTIIKKEYIPIDKIVHISFGTYILPYTAVFGHNL